MKKIGIFGSAFNPLHLGHLHLLVQAQKHFRFDKIKVIPCFKSPFKDDKLTAKLKTAKLEQKLNAIKQALLPYPFLEVDDIEIKRGGVSYTIDTLLELSEQINSFNCEIFIIMGADQWFNFPNWKNPDQIRQKAHIVVCSREGYKMPPKKVLSTIVKNNFKNNVNKTKKNLKNVYALPLKNMDISSLEIRKRYTQGLSISHLVPLEIKQWIDKNNLYQEKKQNPLPDTKALAQFCIKTLNNKKAKKIKSFDLKNYTNQVFDFTVVASGLNTRHSKALCDDLQRQVKKQFSLSPKHIEGHETGDWIALDYGDLAIHIFYEYKRQFYQLEKLWG